jgi:hypothetical protein
MENSSRSAPQRRRLFPDFESNRGLWILPTSHVYRHPSPTKPQKLSIRPRMLNPTWSSQAVCVHNIESRSTTPAPEQQHNKKNKEQDSSHHPHPKLWPTVRVLTTIRNRNATIGDPVSFLGPGGTRARPAGFSLAIYLILGHDSTSVRQ